MKKKLFLAILVATLFACIFAISASAITQAEADKYYYDKVYVTADGQHELALYEKEGDTYYPLIWFAYDILGEDGTTVVETKYVKVRFEDVDCYSDEPSQGRFNGVYYNYTDENGNSMVLDSRHAVLINLRGGIMSTATNSSGTKRMTNVVQKTLEWGKGGYPSFTSKLEAVYLPLTATTAAAPKSVRVFDIDRHHTATISIATQAFLQGNIKEIFIPASADLKGGNSQFKMCYSLETVVFGKGFNNQHLGNWFFDGAPLKRVYYMDSEEMLNTITVAEIGMGSFTSLERISLTNYLALDKATQDAGKYLIYDVTECYLYGHDVELVNACAGQCKVCKEYVVNHSAKATCGVSVVYADFAQAGKKITTCQSEGCTYTNEETLGALISCNGYSVDQKNQNGIVISYRVDLDAIDEYAKLTGKTVKYGVYAAAKTALEGNDIIAEDGAPSKGAVMAEISTGYIALQLKMGGISDKNALFTMGAYFEISDESSKEYAYVEGGKKLEGEKYYFVSYNSVVGVSNN